MTRFRRSTFPLFLLILVLVLLVFMVPAASGHKGDAVSIGDVSFLDIVTFATGTKFADTEVGGFSGITYDPAKNVYYVLSDDRSEKAPSRYYTVAIEMVGGQLDVELLDVTFLRDENGEEFAQFAIDPESIELVHNGQLFVSTEGDEDSETDPAIMRFNKVGRQTLELPVPAKFLYSVDGDNNVRNNLAFESLTASPNGRYLYVATENALVNDGPVSTLTNGSASRFLQYQLPRRQPMSEYVYCVDPIPQAPDPPGAFADHGLVEIQALDDAGTFLALERSFAVGVGNTILLFETSTEGATDVSGTADLDVDLLDCSADGVEPMGKELIVDLEADLGVDPDNVEGMAVGPMLSADRQLLILVSDNNFRGSQITQFIALSVELVTE